MDLRELAERLNDKIDQLLPEGFSNTRNDVRANVHAWVQEAFSSLNLVSREEFELQKEVLQRTRLRLEQAEKDLQELEKKFEALALPERPVS